MPLNMLKANRQLRLSASKLTSKGPGYTTLKLSNKKDLNTGTNSTFWLNTDLHGLSIDSVSTCTDAKASKQG